MKVEYQNANVFNGQEFVKTNFTVEDGNFKDVDKSNGADKVVDLKGRFITPGLINSHTHITISPDPFYWNRNGCSQSVVTKTILALQNLKEALSVGVTYVRDVGSTANIDLDLMKLDLPDLPGIIGSGRALSMTGGHGSNKNGSPKEGTLEVDGVDSVRAGAREVLKNGARNVKLMATGGVASPGETPFDVQLSEEELKAAVEEAHHKGFPAAAHAQGTEGIKNAVRAGIDSVEHAIFMDDEAVQLMKEHGTTVVPTLVAPRAIYENPEQLPSFMVKKAQQVAKEHLISIKKIVQAGIPVAMGTDAGTPYNTFGDWVITELKMYLDAGMTPVQVLNSATAVAAKLLRIDDYVGKIADGYEANFVVLENNPLEDFEAFGQEIAVYRKGKLVVNRLMNLEKFDEKDYS